MKISTSSVVLICILVTPIIVSSCTYGAYELDQAPAYDYLIGRDFDDVVFLTEKQWKVVSSSDSVNEYTNYRPDGCVLVFGVRKADRVIEYWRVDSGPGTCYTRRKALDI